MKTIYRSSLIVFLVLIMFLVSSCDGDVFQPILPEYNEYIEKYFPPDGDVYDYEFTDQEEVVAYFGTNSDFNNTKAFYKNLFLDESMIILNEEDSQDKYYAQGKNSEVSFSIIILPFDKTDNQDSEYRTKVTITAAYTNITDNAYREIYTGSYIDISESTDKKSIGFELKNPSLEVLDDDYFLSIYINGDLFMSKAECEPVYISKSAFLTETKNVLITVKNSNNKVISSTSLDDFIVYDTRKTKKEILNTAFEDAKSIAVFGRKWDSISKLVSLMNPEVLDFGNTKFAGTSLLENGTKLKALTLLDGITRDLDFLTKQESLTRLNVWVRDTSKISNLKDLKHLSLYGTKNLNGLENFKNLESLALDYCTVSDLSSILSLKNLKSIEIINCERSIDFASIAMHGGIESLVINSCDNIKNIYEPSNFVTVKTLEVVDSKGFSGLEFLNSFTSLKKLRLEGLKQIVDLAPLTELDMLESLYIDELDDVKSLMPLITLRSLKKLSIDSDKDLFPISSLSMLEELELKNASDLSPVSSITSLKSITVNGTNDFSPLRDLTEIISFKSSSVLSEADFNSLPSSIQSFDLSGSKSITDLSFLDNFENITFLNISGCSNINDISSLSKLTKLKSLDISGCTKLSDISSISKLASLERLNMHGCKGIKDISYLAKLKNLKEVDLSRCDKIRDYSPITDLNIISYIK
jgi:hypothetical protein